MKYGSSPGSVLAGSYSFDSNPSGAGLLLLLLDLVKLGGPVLGLV
jgi:hypothetical protein